MKWIKPPIILRWYYGSDVTWSFPSKEKTIFLTFDDGPTMEVTSEILTILKNYNAKDTFFNVCENVIKYPELYQQIFIN